MKQCPLCSSDIVGRNAEETWNEYREMVARAQAARDLGDKLESAMWDLESLIGSGQPSDQDEDCCVGRGRLLSVYEADRGREAIHVLRRAAAAFRELDRQLR